MNIVFYSSLCWMYCWKFIFLADIFLKINDILKSFSFGQAENRFRTLSDRKIFFDRSLICFGFALLFASQRMFTHIVYILTNSLVIHQYISITNSILYTVINKR